ncbi:hypothetical protein [Mycobacterium sp. HUMS_1102779]|uniref:hypothetical protein n=1 Tax=Mycobacterium sp. HUMS_1102779 TaxID=3383487 RepID=UPI00389A9F94
MPTSSDSHLEEMLGKIGRRVLEDVWLSRRVRAVAGVAVAALAAATVLGCLSLATVQARTSWLSCVATALFGLTASVSSLAVCRPRFRWCCTSAYISVVATIAGLGMVWWHRTAPPGSAAGVSAWMVTGVLCTIVLSLTWLAVILTPWEHSQPDMRVAAEARIGPRDG